jgi:hypothetical protein
VGVEVEVEVEAGNQQLKVEVDPASVDDNPRLHESATWNWVTVRELRRAYQTSGIERRCTATLYGRHERGLSRLSYNADARPCYETSAQNLDRPVSTRYLPSRK